MEKKTSTRSVSSNRAVETTKDVKQRTGGTAQPGPVQRGGEGNGAAAIPRKNKSYNKYGRGGHFGGSARKTKGKDPKQVEDGRQYDAMKDDIDDYVSYMERINQNGRDKNLDEGQHCVSGNKRFNTSRDNRFNTDQGSSASFGNVQGNVSHTSRGSFTDWADCADDDWLDHNIDKYEDMRQNGSRRKPSLKIITDKGYHSNQSKGSQFERPYHTNNKFGGNYNHSGYGNHNKSSSKSKGAQLKATRERLLQARCKFLLNPKITAQHQAAKKLPVGCSAPDVESMTEMDIDPDSLVPWEAVEQVTVQGNDLPNCPICLYPPTAPQITRCGHVYCYACMLHTLALTDGSWVKCPICEQPVVVQDLKSVEVTLYRVHPVGSSVRMTLMALPPGASVPVPVEDSEMPPLVPRCAPAVCSVVEEIVSKEIEALEVKMALEAGEPEAIFIEQALALVKERRRRISSEYADDHDIVQSLEELSLGRPKQQNKNKSVNKSADKEMSKDCVANLSEGSAKKGKNKRNRKSNRNLAFEFECAFEAPPSKAQEVEQNMKSEVTLSEDGIILGSVISRCSVSSEDCVSLEGGDAFEGSVKLTAKDDNEQVEKVFEGIPEEKLDTDFTYDNTDNGGMRSSDLPKSDAGTVYFYQTSDGSNVYLLPLNMAMLLHSYGTATALPPTITATILEKDCCVVSSSGRQRCKQLRTLPLYCPFELLECEVSALVSQDTLQEFSAPLRRKREAREERCRMERQIERRNAAQYQKELSSVLYSRVYSATAATSAAAAAATSAVSPAAAAIEDSAVAPEASASQTNSFAKIVQHGPPTPSWAPSPSSPSTTAWPTLSSRAKKAPSTPAPSTAPAWGAPAPQTPLSPSTPAGHSSGRGGGRRKKNKK